MSVIGTIESLWRYPVKSMAGEPLTQAYMSFAGFYGDRCYAFKHSAGRKGFPYLSATVQEKLLLYRPRFRHPHRAAQPPNLLEAMDIGPGVNPVNPDPDDMAVDVLTPSGATLPIDDPALAEKLTDGLRGENDLTLVRSDRAMTDCRPVSLISLQTVTKIGEEVGEPLDKRRFRANIYLDLESDQGFAEDTWVGRRVRLGDTAEVALIERDPRCKMISLDPETGEHNPEVLRTVAKDHATYAGLYAAVLVEGVFAKGDRVELLD